jgi:cold shock CspA family protein
MEKHRRLLGRICFYDASKGFGFIRVPGQGSDYHVSRRHIRCATERLTSLQLVSFVPQNTPDGPIAVDVTTEEPEIRFGEVKEYNALTGEGLITGSNGVDYPFARDNLTFSESILFPGRLVCFAPKRGQEELLACGVQLAHLRLIEPEAIKAWVEMAHTPREWFDPFAWVYVFQRSESSYTSKGAHNREGCTYKIGYSSKPHRRRKEIKRKYGGVVSVFHQIGTNSGLELEQVLHRVFQAKTAPGQHSWEWFQLDEDDLVWLKNLSRVDVEILRDLATREIGQRLANQLLQGRGQ